MAEKLRAFFPNLDNLIFSKRNKLAQARSWWKMVQSKVSAKKTREMD